MINYISTHWLIISLTIFQLIIIVLMIYKSRLQAGRALQVKSYQQRIEELIAANTALEHVQKDLAISEERFRLAIQGSNDGLWDWDLISNDVYFSRRWKSILGYEADELPDSLDTWKLHTYEKDLPNALERVQQFIEGQSSTYEVEFRMKHKDGSLVSVLARGYLMRDEQGKAMRIIGTHHDLTAQYKHEEKLKEQVEENLALTEEYKTINEELYVKNNDLLAAEEELRANLEELYEKNQALERSEERFRHLSALTNEGIFIHKQGVVIDVNYSACRLLGYTADELIGQQVIELLAAEGERESLYARLAQGEPEPFESIVIHKSGQHIPVAVNGKNTFYQNDPVRVIAIRDITERILSEQRLKESEERLRLALKGTNDGLWDWNVTTGEVYFSARWKEMLGYADDELTNALSTWQDLMHPDDVIETTETVNQFIRGDRSDYEVEFRMRHKSGRYLHILSRGYLMTDTIGQVVRIIGTHQDLTRRYAIEEKLREQVEENLSLYEEYRTISEELHAKNNDLLAAEEELRANNEELYQKNQELQESEERYRLLFDNLNEGFASHELVLDANGRPIDYIFRDVNPVFLSRIGLKYEAIINKRAKELFPDTEQEWIERFANVALSGQSERFVNYSTVLDKYYQTHVFSPKKGYFAAIFEDVTESRKAEEKLRDSEMRFKSLFEKSQSVMIVMEADTGQLVNANEAAVNFYGYKKDELIGMNIRQINVLPPEEVSKALQLADEYGQPYFSFKHRLKSGEIRNIDAYTSRLYYGDKAMLFTIVIDVTEAVRSHVELEMINRRFQGLENIVHYQAQSINDLLDYALNEVIEYTKSDLGLFYHYDEKKNVFLLNNWSTEGRLTYRSPAETMQSDRLDCLSQAIARKEMIILNEQDVTYPFIIAEDRGGKYNSVSIPVVVNNQVEGVMWLGSQTTHYSVFDMKQVSLLLETTWILVEKQRLHDQLQ